MIKLAIQKSGRLSEKSLEIIQECGIHFSSSTRRLVNTCSNFPMEILYLRDDDIPGYVADGVADIGIVGENVLLEKQKSVNIEKRLGFSKCRLSLAVPRGDEYNHVKDLEGKYIATSYPNILKKYFKEQGVNADVHEISGSVEIAPGIGFAYAICDIVSTGSTLQSEAILFASNNLDAEKRKLLDQLIFRIESVNKARKNKYIVLNAPKSAVENIKRILPGMKSPTVTPLATEGWFSISSVIAEDYFWEIIEQLKAEGAEGILVMPIEKMIL